MLRNRLTSSLICRNDRGAVVQRETLPLRGSPLATPVLAGAGVTGHPKKLQKRDKSPIRTPSGQQKAVLTTTAVVGDVNIDANARHAGPSATSFEPEVGGASRGTMFGAICLITGSTVGAGILALPAVTAPSGALPSGVGLVGTWVLLTAQALLMAEVNLELLSKSKKRSMVTLRQMAERTLGTQTGGHAVSSLYLVLSYSLLIAYSSKISQVVNSFLPSPFVDMFNPTLISVIIAIATGLIFVNGGSSSADRLNQTCTGLLFLLFGTIIASSFGAGSAAFSPESSIHSTASSNWSMLPSALPIMFLTLVYHDLVPFLCYYLGGDKARVKSALLIGSLVPLLMVLLWNSTVLASIPNAFDVTNGNPLEEFVRSSGSFTGSAVQLFSFLAVITSYLSTVIGFTETVCKDVRRVPVPLFQEKSRDSKTSNRLLAAALSLGPPLLWNIFYPDLFIRLLSFSGGYLMVGLYGIMPPCMAWASRRKQATTGMLPGGHPVLLSLLVASSGIAMAQFFLN